MERTCKDCKHYEPYSGSKPGYVMFCPYRSKKMEHDGLYRNFETCGSDFTPKEPVKISLKPAGEHCKGCMYENMSCTECVCGPFPKEQARPIYGSRPTIMQEQLRAFEEAQIKAAQMAINPPMIFPSGMYIDKPKSTPKKAKEKPMLAKFTSRRYVMLCTLYVTTKIAIVLNPWLFRLAGLVRPEWGSIRGKLIREGNGNYIREMIPVPWDSGSWKQIAAVWACAILVCTAICGAIYAFNEATAWIFGEKK